MIELKIPRQHAKVINEVFFNFVQHLKITNMKNVESCSKISTEYLTALLFNCLLDEVDQLLLKKLVNTNSENITIKLSVAQAIAFYRCLMILPVPAEHFYFQLIRNNCIELLHQQIIK